MISIYKICTLPAISHGNIVVFFKHNVYLLKITTKKHKMNGGAIE